MEHYIKKTPLNQWHRDHKANMAVFGGYGMPLWYPSGVKSEHCAAITHAGLFDTSHMAVILVSGTGACALLQRCFTRDLNACVGKDASPLFAGRCVYGIFLDAEGNTIDDAIVYRLSDDRFMIVVNAGMGATIAAHLRTYTGDMKTDITDMTDRVGKCDLQGPLAAKILSKVLAAPDAIFNQMPYFSFKGYFDAASALAETVKLADGTPLMLSRTGYTGEFGFELFTGPDAIVHVWEMLFEAGRDMGLIPCGLAARDSLRAGAVLPLSHQDIGHWPFIHNPWTFALPWNREKTGFTKTFAGAEALLKLKDAEITYPFVGSDLRKVSTHDKAAEVLYGNQVIGIVLTCATDMATGMADGRIYSIASPDAPSGFIPGGLCCGFIKVTRKLTPGDTVVLKDARRSIKVTITGDIRPHRTARNPLRQMID
ncbi:MAG: aminomethyltransferase family protein [Deltaproteobacteria bacterium]|nr:aminomethyltransferase family protein [Deltaproteobacteria bacterium]